VVVKKQTVKKWKIATLRDHPRQAEMFGDVDEEELKALAESMRKRGQRDSVEITPDGTVIAGHQRVRAAKLLGWTEIDAVVRHDLAAGGETAIEEHFIEDNFVRRQLSPLARAKCIKRLMELEAGREAGRFGFGKKEELKKRIAARMGLSARSVSRYLLLLDAPAAVQRVFDRGLITLIVAGKVALLPKAAQAEVARRIAAGETPAAVIGEHTRGCADSASPSKAFVRLVACLRRELPRLRGRAKEIRSGRLANSAATLREATAVLTEFASAAGRPAG
jgi:ParB family chromosome partitioning protein